MPAPSTDRTPHPFPVGGWGALGAEERVLVLLARLEPSAELLARAAETAARPGFSWPTVLSDAAHLWVHPLVAANALSPPLAPVLPESIRRAWLLAPLAARARRRAYLRVMIPIVEEWATLGVQATLLKGAALMETVYPVGCRMLNDFDVLVPEDRLVEAAQVLEREGFTRYTWPGHARPAAGEEPKGRVYVLERAGDRPRLVVDLHARLTAHDSPFALSATACVAAGSELGLGAATVRVLSREDVVVHLATQLATDMEIKLHRVADLAAVVGSIDTEGGGRLDWDRVRARAQEARAEGAVALALRWAEAMGATVPARLADDLEALTPGSGRATAVLFDARAVVPRFRLRASATLALAHLYARPRPLRRRLIVGVPKVVYSRQRLEGTPLLGALWHAARSLPLTAAARAVVRLAGTLRSLGLPRAATGLGRLLWVDDRARPQSIGRTVSDAGPSPRARSLRAGP